MKLVFVFIDLKLIVSVCLLLESDIKYFHYSNTLLIIRDYFYNAVG